MGTLQCDDCFPEQNNFSLALFTDNNHLSKQSVHGQCPFTAMLRMPSRGCCATFVGAFATTVSSLGSTIAIDNELKL